jgi:hypothetical protein
MSGRYVIVNEKFCAWSKKNCWSCKKHDAGWSDSVCKTCLRKRTLSDHYPLWKPRMFDRRKLDDAYIDVMTT